MIKEIMSEDIPKLMTWHKAENSGLCEHQEG